ncbi:MAG: hypothetical protein RBS80_07655 [Thermoguttaceae bacterium]|jgi:hypothetical protein|nr:hypothetical protein [Thermoguttaceae bacterium]
MNTRLHSAIEKTVNRRNFLRTAAATAVAGTLATRRGAAGANPGLAGRWDMKPRPDLLSETSPKGLEVFQLTTEPDVPASHVYMEAQIFMPDSKRLVLHRAAHAHGPMRGDPRHQYLRCDLDDGGSLHPLTDETGAIAPSVSPDGKHLYYIVDETTLGGGKVTLKRVGLDGTGRETITVIDSPLPGTAFRPSRIYPLSTISSDGRRLATAAFLGDGQADPPPYGLMVFDLQEGSVELVLHGPTWCNLHPQYCRSTEPDASRDILVQENHGNVVTPTGQLERLVGPPGADIHVIRDDGTNFRNMPWGRDGNEHCQGHQCWRGRTTWAITSTSTREPREAQLIEGRATPHADHVGIATPGGVRNDLTREFPSPHFYHFATDVEGCRLVSDSQPMREGGAVWVADLGRPGEDPLSNFVYLLNPRSSCGKEAHIHPFLSPDGTMAFFNSDESGVLQAYMVRIG